MKVTASKAITFVFGLSFVVLAVAVVGLALTDPDATEPYTEFYVLGEDGKAANYPKNLSVGETGTVVVGIENHEHRRMTYTMVVSFGHDTVATRTLEIAAERGWTDNVTFTASTPGTHKLSFNLYEGGEPGGSENPYRSLRLWIRVKPSGANTSS